MHRLPKVSYHDIERIIEFDFVRATEAAALNSLRWLGRGDKEAADAAACDAMRGMFDLMNICGEVVIGEGIKDEASGIFKGEQLGTGEPGAELLALKNSGRFILDALTNHDFAANVHQIEHAAHRVAGGRIGGFFVAAPEPSERIECRRFRRADKVELNDAFDVVVTDLRKTMHCGALSFPQSFAMTT